MNRDRAQDLWILLLKKYLADTPEIYNKLMKIRFYMKGSMIKKGNMYEYAEKHFPHLLKLFEEMRTYDVRLEGIYNE